MLFYPYIELASSLFILLVVFHIYTRHYENRTARIFVRFGIIVFLACILSYSYRIAFTEEFARYLNRFSASLFGLSFSIYAHFALVFTKRDSFLKNKFFLAAFYLPPLLLSGLFLFTDQMYLRYEILAFGFASLPAPLYWLFVAQTCFYSVWGIILFLLYSIKGPQKSARMQALLIVIGSIIPLTLGVMTDEILPLVQGMRAFPPTSVVGIAVLNLFIFIAMRRYSLFAISPALAADTIIKTMPDSMLVTDLDGKIMLLNEEAQKYFRVPKEEIVGQEIVSLFERKEKYEKLYDQVVNRKLEIARYDAALITPLGERTPSLINANMLRDELGSPMGVVYIIRDVRG